MQSGLQREEIEFIMALFSNDEPVQNEAETKELPQKDYQKLDTAQFKSQYTAS
ncbi:hypothetical protein [Pseudoalteromonas mariniglutinosa]|uniref:hypothetical protein n=1 Tax=Pseudoalteromonas mariniglutinosa TaxID=206042 RepID=UPI00385092E6